MTKRQQFLKILESLDVAMFTNLNERGALVSHPMNRNKHEEDDYLWFFTRKDAEKVVELQKDPRVNVSFAKGDYLSVAGEAEIVEDLGMKQKLWTKENEAFFGTKVDDPNIILIKVVMDSAEYWKGGNPIAIAYQFVKGIIKEDEPVMGENEAVEL